MCGSLLATPAAPPALAIFGAYLLSDALWSLTRGPPLRADMWAHHAIGATLLGAAAAAWSAHPAPINAAARALLWMEATTPFLNGAWLFRHAKLPLAALGCDGAVVALWPWARLRGPLAAIAAVWAAYMGGGGGGGDAPPLAAQLARLPSLPAAALFYFAAAGLLAALQVVWGVALARRFVESAAALRAK